MWKRILEPVARTTTPLIVHVIHVGFQCSSDVIYFFLILKMLINIYFWSTMLPINVYGEVEDQMPLDSEDVFIQFLTIQ